MKSFNSNNVKLISLLFFIIIVFAGYFFFKLIFLAGRNGEEVAKKEVNDSRPGYINLPSEEIRKKSYFGKVIALEARFNVEGTHQLVDKEGNSIILLKANDDKLVLAEGRFVTVSGVLEKTSSGEKVLVVEKILFK